MPPTAMRADPLRPVTTYNFQPPRLSFPLPGHTRVPRCPHHTFPTAASHRPHVEVGCPPRNGCGPGSRPSGPTTTTSRLTPTTPERGTIAPTVLGPLPAPLPPRSHGPAPFLPPHTTNVRRDPPQRPQFTPPATPVDCSDHTSTCGLPPRLLLCRARFCRLLLLPIGKIAALPQPRTTARRQWHGRHPAAALDRLPGDRG